ncbi:hypothetical protein C5614_13275 [Massilia phosphatilytica]|nr:hypothetical protein C5614_13275 [Massilia phosphatilytica]
MGLRANVMHPRRRGEPSALRVEGECGRGVQMVEAPREPGELVADRTAVACRQAAADFLQQQEIEAGAGLQHPVDDTVEVGAAVRRAGALHVPGEQCEHGDPFEIVRLARH